MSTPYHHGPPASQTLSQMRQLMAQANEEDQRGEYDKEVAHLMEAVTLSQAGIQELSMTPVESAEALDQIAMNLYKHSEEDIALNTVDQALSLLPTHVEAVHHKALFLIAMNRDVVTAVRLLDYAIGQSPHDKTLWASKADALKVLGKTEGAVNCYLQAQQLDAASTQYVDKALKVQPDNPKALQMKLDISIRMGGMVEAISTCRQLVASNPNDPNLQFTLTNLLVNSALFDEALSSVEKALSIQPENPAYLYAKARILREMGRTKDAFELYRVLLTKKVEAPVHVLLEVAGAMEARHLDPDLLIMIRLRILELDPRNLANIQSLQEIAQARGDRELSLRVYDAWLTLSPHNLEAETALAQIFTDSGEIEKALSTYGEVARYHPDETRYIRMGLDLAHKNHLNDRVVGFASAILAKDHGDTTTMEWLEDAYAELGKWREAMDVTDRLLHLSPMNAQYLKRMKACLSALGRHNEIPPIIDKIFEQDPASYDIAVERAKMYHYWAEHAPPDSQHREAWAKEALRSFERASLAPDQHSDCLLGMAKTFRLIRKPDKAEEAYVNFLQIQGNEKRGDVLKELGHVLRELGRNSDALEKYQKAVEYGCEDTDLLWGLAEVLRSLNENAKALHYLEILIQREPRNPLFLRRYGRTLTETDRKAEGLQHLKMALSLQERDPTAYFELADALKETGAYQDAVGYYQQGIHLDSTNQLAMLSYIETLILTGKNPDAIREIDAILRLDPSNVRGWALRLQAFKFLKNDNEMLYSLKAILTLNPSDSMAWEEKHRIHLQRGEKAEAYAAITSLIETSHKKSDLPRLYLTKGDLASEVGKLEEAMTAYDETVKVDPSLKNEAEYCKAKAYGENDKPKEALRILEAFGEPPYPSPITEKLTHDILTLRGALSFDLGQFGDALEMFEVILKKDPADPDTCLWKGRTLLELGRHQDAKSYISQVLSNIPRASSAEGYLYLSEAESGIGSQSDAVAACSQGLQFSPANVPLLLRLGDLKAKEEKWQEAGDAYARAVAADRNNAESHFKIGLVHEKLGHQNEAIREYREAVRLEPGNPHAHLNLGLLLLDMGQADEALASVEEALKIDPDLEAAREAKQLAVQKNREIHIEKYSKKALLLSAKTNRPVTKNDLFITLQVPWDLIDPVMREVSKVIEINVNKLSDKELMDLEGMSYHLITQAMEHRLPGVDRGTLTLADVALLSPQEYSLVQIQRLMGYVQSVLSMNLRPEDLKLSRDVEDQARKALTLAPEERTPFRLVKNLRIGIYKAMVIKAVESMTMDHHAPMPAVNLSGMNLPVPPSAPPQPSPSALGVPQSAYMDGGPQALSATEPLSSDTAATPSADTSVTTLVPAPQGARCSGCGGQAAYTHTCGANICRHCIVQFSSCPKCSLTLSLSTQQEAFDSPPPRPETTDMPMAFIPASKRMSSEENMETGRQPSGRPHRVSAKPRRPATVTDEDPHL